MLNLTFDVNQTSNITVDLTHTMSTLPLFNDALWYTTLLSTLASMLAVGGSTGGGGMQIGIFLALLKFDVSEATMLARIVVLSVTSVTFLFSIRQKDPNGTKPVIDYDISMLMGPISILGSNFGVMLNKVLSEYIVLSGMVLVLLFSFVSSVRSALALRKAEKEIASINSNAIEMSSESEELIEISGEDMEIAEFNIQEKMSADRGDQILEIQSREHLQYPWESFAILGISVFGSSFLLLLSGGKSQSFIPGVFCGTWQYFFIVFSSVPFLVGISGLVMYRLHRAEKKKQQLGYPRHEADFSWTPMKLWQFPILGFIGGILSGAGIGGALIQAPLMLSLGVNPATMSATSSFVLFLNTLSNSVTFFATGTLRWDWGLWFLGFSAVGAIFGKVGLDRAVKYFKMQSIIVFVLSFLILLTAAGLIFVGVQTVLSGKASWNFKPLCAEFNSENSDYFTGDFWNLINYFTGKISGV